MTKLQPIKVAFLVLLALLCQVINAQTITPQVINSAGMPDRQLGSQDFFVSDNVGELFTLTNSVTTMMITEGFLQPRSGKTYTYSIQISPVTCKDKKDGLIAVTFKSSYANTQVSYQWTGPDGSTVAGDSSIDSIPAGAYSLTMVYTYSIGTSVKTGTVMAPLITVTNSDLNCFITIFTGITPNGDGINDVWTIGNISEFPKNKVHIFNRWGAQVEEIAGYNNVDKVWPSKGILDGKSSSTYFYIIDLGNGTKPYKGWVEVIKD